MFSSHRKSPHFISVAVRTWKLGDSAFDHCTQNFIVKKNLGAPEIFYVERDSSVLSCFHSAVSMAANISRQPVMPYTVSRSPMKI